VETLFTRRTGVPQQITAPEDGDSVVMLDGRTGAVGDIDEVEWDGGSDWKVTVNFDDENSNLGEGEDEMEDESEISIRWDGTEWKEYQ
jgi:hypothetical protein